MIKKKLEEGDIFYVPYNGKYFFGKLLMDVSQRILKKEEVISLKFYDGCYLIGVYKGIYDEPVLTESEFVIPSIYTFKKYFYSKNHKIDWHFYKNEIIDLKKDISFPESLISVHKVGICFRSGELEIPTTLNREDYDSRFDIKGNISSSYYSVLRNACHYGGRDDLMDFKPHAFLEAQDLRFAPEKRIEIYKQMGEDPNSAYYELALKHGLDIERFYK